MKKVVMIICVICAIVIFCVLAFIFVTPLSNLINPIEVILVTKQDGVELKFYADRRIPHGGDSHLSLFCKNKLICSNVGGSDPMRFLLSPDSNLILYLSISPEGEKYGIYSIKEDKIIKSSEESYLVGLHKESRMAR